MADWNRRPPGMDILGWVLGRGVRTETGCSREPLERVQRWYGGRINPPNAKGVSYLVLYGPRALRLLDSIRPYLSERRKQQMDDALVRRWPGGPRPDIQMVG